MRASTRVKELEQQIGTGKRPTFVEYNCACHREANRATRNARQWLREVLHDNGYPSVEPTPELARQIVADYNEQFPDTPIDSDFYEAACFKVTPGIEASWLHEDDTQGQADADKQLISEWEATHTSRGWGRYWNAQL